MVIKYDKKSDRLIYVKLPKVQTKGTLMRNSSGARVRWRVITVTANYTIRPEDDVVHVDATGGSITITLFDGTTTRGKNVYIKRIDSTLGNGVTFAVQGNEKIEFESLHMLVNEGSGAEVYSDGTDFFLKSA